MGLYDIENMETDVSETKTKTAAKSKVVKDKDLDLTDFETKVAELTELLTNLEKNDVDLSQAIVDFESASKLIAQVEKQLDTAKMKVSKLIGSSLEEVK